MPTYIRVKDLANAATTPATDDFILLSGAANGARKISRADFLTAVAGFYTADPSTYKLATLDSGNKVLVSQLPSSAFSYKGTWAASTNTPTLTNGTGTGGDTYYASDSGSVNFGAGSISFLAGDAVVYDGSVWQKVPDVVNLLDGKGTLDEAKTTLEIPDVGTSPQEVPLNGQLGTMAFQDSAGVSVGQLEVESTTGTGSTQALTVTDGTSTHFAIDENGKTIIGPATTGRTLTVAMPDNSGGAVVVEEGSNEYLRINTTNGSESVVIPTGLVGIGNSSPGAGYSSAADDLVVGDGVGDRGLTVVAGTGDSSYILFADGTGFGSYRGRIQYNHNVDQLYLGASGASNWKIVGATGNLERITAGAGIDFGTTTTGSGSVATNGGLLADYEEGTATISDSSGAGLTYTGTACNYIKVGNKVTVWITVTFPTTSDGSSATIGGLPYAFGSSTVDQLGGSLTYTDLGSSVSILGNAGTSAVTIRNHLGQALVNSAMSGKTIWFSVTYDVS